MFSLLNWLHVEASFVLNIRGIFLLKKKGNIGSMKYPSGDNVDPEKKLSHIVHEIWIMSIKK